VILERMPGTRITSPATIGDWIRGTVYGPGDNEDLKRFARAVGDDALLAQSEAVGAALRTLRGIHIKLGLWLAGQVSGAAGRTPESVVDAELGVCVADLLDAIAEYEVTAVDRTERPTSVDQVGLLMDPTSIPQPGA
jgi:hypothetical protein